jgi:hypothetical protein
MKIGLLSCANLPEPDHDEQPFVGAFARLDAHASTLAWDGPTVDLASFDALVLRATWNYPEKPDDFTRFCERADEATVLLNSLETVKRNLHKGYLLDLAAAGIPIVPTIIVRRGQTTTDAELPSGAVVVKPAISCGSYRTRCFDESDRAAAVSFAGVLAEDGDVLVQPMISGFRDPGERALVWIDGELSHAVLKRPRFEGQEESVTRLESVSRADRELARLVLDSAGGDWMYARVDVVDSADGTVVSELECIEPSLFFWAHPQAADRLAAAVVREATNRRR